MTGDDYANAVRLHQQGDMEAAERGYRDVLKENDGHMGAWHLLGVLLHQRGEHDAAMAHIQTSIDLGNRQAACFNNLGAIYLTLAELEPAEREFQRAISINPNFADAYTNLGHVAYRRGELTAAGNSFRTALEVNPAHTPALAALGRLLLEEGQPLAALAHLRQAVQTQPGDAHAWKTLGHIYIAISEPEKAVDAFRRAHSILPSDTDTQFSLGTALDQIGEYEEGERRRMAAIKSSQSSTPDRQVAVGDFLLNENGQWESLRAIYASLPIRTPLPAMRGWAVSPDFAREYLELILLTGPQRIVELGSGISTLIAGYAVERLGQGRVVAIDHQVGFAQQTSNRVRQHGLSSVVEVRNAPLCSIAWPQHLPRDVLGSLPLPAVWYDFRVFQDLKPIDLLLIDGPIQPPDRNQWTRYPALPLLIQLLAPQAYIVLDDAARLPERQTIEDWLWRYPLTVVSQPTTEKGMAILKYQAAG